jgi:hypothetical protein
MSGSPYEKAKDLPPLNQSNYLDHLDFFQQLYSSGNRTKEANGPACIARGLVIVVAVGKETATTMADYVARKLGGAARIDDLNAVEQNNIMPIACQDGRCHVCSATVGGGGQKLRTLTKKYDSFITVVLYACSEAEIKALELPQNEYKKTIGMLKHWRKTRCAHVFDLPQSALPLDKAVESDDGNQNNAYPTFAGIIESLKLTKASDSKPGLLVFFAQIPGSGKSACVTGIEHELSRFLKGKKGSQPRNFTVQVGDSTKEKYWPLVKRLVLQDPSSILVADKNAPSGIWSTVGSICAAAKVITVPVIPDKHALQTTRVAGIRTPDGSLVEGSVHLYPFSLQYLAVCMTRVLGRDSGSHPGGLDVSTHRACMIVVKFFSLYRNITADELVDTIRSEVEKSGALMSSSPIEVPFFDDKKCNASTSTLAEEVLYEALQIQVRSEFCGRHVYAPLLYLNFFFL